MARSEKILIVEDELGIRVLLSEVLLNAGFQVSLAEDGMESLDQMQSSNFDLVITDLQMPRLDGIGLLKWMKKAGRKEKIIVMTGSAMDQRLEEEDVPHVVTHLEKPFGMENFVNVVIDAVGGSK